MQMNTAKLKGKMVERGYSSETLAKAIGIDTSTFYRKMKAQGIMFTLGQMQGMTKILNLTREEACDIFLCQNSHKREISQNDTKETGQPA